MALSDNAVTELDHNNPLSTSSAEMLDNKEIDNALDEFSKMLSDYSCDGNATDPVAPSAAQTRLESLFTTPDKNDNPSQPAPAGHCLSTTPLPAAKENPEDVASIR